MATDANATRWTMGEMLIAAQEWDDRFDPAECEVREVDDGRGDRCLVVLHVPTGRTTDEAADAGRWHPDGTAYHS